MNALKKIGNKLILAAIIIGIIVGIIIGIIGGIGYASECHDYVVVLGLVIAGICIAPIVIDMLFNLLKK